MSYILHTNIKAKSISYGGSRKAGDIKYLIYHYTGNITDKAVNNAKFYRDGNTRKAGAHFFVDDTDVYQSIDDLLIANAVGGSKWDDCAKTGGGTMHGIVKNANSISIEMCSTNGQISDATLNNAVELGKVLMAKYNITIDRVYRHFDVNGKHCPGWAGWYGAYSPKWYDLKNRLVSNKTSLKDVQSEIKRYLNGEKGASLANAQKMLREYLGVTNAVVKKDVQQETITAQQTHASTNAIVAAGQVHTNNFNQNKDYKLTIDGIRGSATQKGGVMVLQTALNLDYKAGLQVDGIFGEKSTAALKNHYVKKGETQYLVTAVEILLMLKGYNPNGVECPGVFGSGLESAVRQYQKDNGLTVDGVAGANTIKSLIS